MSPQLKIICISLKSDCSMKNPFDGFWCKRNTQDFHLSSSYLLPWMSVNQAGVIQYSTTEANQCCCSWQRKRSQCGTQDIPCVVEVFPQCGTRMSSMWYQRHAEQHLCNSCSANPTDCGTRHNQWRCIWVPRLLSQFDQTKKFPDARQGPRQKQVGWWNWLVCY